MRAGGGVSPELVSALWPVGLPLVVPFGSSLLTRVENLGDPRNLPAEARLDDGRRVPIRLHPVRLEIDPASELVTESAQQAASWLGPVSRWTIASDAPDLILAELEFPVDAFGHWVWLGGRRLDIVWLPREEPDAPTPQRAPTARPDAFTRECLRLEALSPLTRWRADLLGVRVESFSLPPIPMLPADAPRIAVRDASPLERLAEQERRLWSGVLSDVSRADAELGARLREELTLVLALETDANRRAVPAWPAPLELWSLRSSLLLSRSDSRAVARVAREWLDARAPGAAWVSDDCGLLDASSSRPLPRVGLINLSPRSALALAQFAGGAAQLDTLAPRTARLFTVHPSPRPDDSVLEPLEVRVGSWTNAVLTQRSHATAQPPGLELGAGYFDHSKHSWLTGVLRSPLASGGSGGPGTLAGRLVREDGPTDVPVGSGWVLYLDAERSPVERQIVRVWLGPSGSPSHVIRVELPESPRIPESQEGSVTVRADNTTQQLPGAQVLASSDRWLVRIPIPTRAIERPSILRLGVEHDRGAVRSAWPRAMFPWQAEPGRTSIDLSKW